ncbi:UNVERIFIED_ORG: hypothetical protein C0V67_04905 [Anaplasma ovis]
MTTLPTLLGTNTLEVLGTTYITKPLSIHSWHPSLTWYHTASPNLWYLLLPLAPSLPRLLTQSKLLVPPT